MDVSDRRPETQHIVKYFAYGHLAEPMRTVSAHCSILKDEMLRELPDGPELTTGLRRLLEAKDCFVRAMLDTVEQPKVLPDGTKLSRMYPVGGMQSVGEVSTGGGS